MIRPPPRSPLFPSTTLSRSQPLAPQEPRRGGGPPREDPQSQAEAALLEGRRHGAPQERVELADPPVLPPRVAAVLPRLEPRRHGLRRRHRGSLVHEQLPQGGAASRVPVVVRPA